MIQIGFKTDQGKTRSVNEDALFVMPKQNVYIVADGVGGHNAGELASRTAVKEIADYIEDNPIGKSADAHQIKNYFNICLNKVNASIVAYSKAGHENKGMATTTVILHLSGKKANIINVGDSRAYMIRAGQISQITEDHTVVNQLLKEGSITRQEADGHPMNNMITRALGGEEKVKPDFYQVDTQKNDVFLLCTDGLYNEVTETLMMEIIMTSTTMHEACNKLIAKANEQSGKDNITTVCVRI